MAGGAIADRAIFIRSADAMARCASALCRGCAFERCQRVSGALDTPGLKLFAKGDLFRCEVLFTGYRRPRCRCVTAVKKLLVDGFVTRSAIRRGDADVDDKSVVIGSFLSLRDLVTIQAIDVLFRVLAHLELVNHRELGVEMALGAFAAGAHKGGAWLLDDDARAARVNEVRRED